MGFRLFVLTIFIFTSISVYGLTLQYKQNSISNGMNLILNMNSIDTGYHLTASSPLNGDSDYVLDTASNTIKWKFLNPVKKVDLESTRVGNTIKMKGKYEGNSIDKTVPINNDPWIEQWEIGLESFILSEEKEKTFWSINPKDVNMIAEFIAVKNSNETIDFNGTKVETVEVKLSLTGILAIFFNSTFYFRQSDGRLLLEVFPKDSKGVVSQIELIE